MTENVIKFRDVWRRMMRFRAEGAETEADLCYDELDEISDQFSEEESAWLRSNAAWLREPE